MHTIQDIKVFLIVPETLGLYLGIESRSYWGINLTSGQELVEPVFAIQFGTGSTLGWRTTFSSVCSFDRLNL